MDYHNSHKLRSDQDVIRVNRDSLVTLRLIWDKINVRVGCLFTRIMTIHDML